MAKDLLKRLRAGQPITEGWLGHVVDAVNLQAAAGNVFVDSTGVFHRRDPRRRRALCRFEMTDALLLPNSGSGQANATVLEWIEPDPDDIQYLLRWEGGSGGDVFAVGQTIRAAVYDPDKTAVVVSVTDNGAEGYMVVDTMSGHGTDGLQNNDSIAADEGDQKTATIAIINAATNLEDTGGTIKVTDTLRMHSKMATITGDVGAYGIAWMADDPLSGNPYDATWEILTMQTPGPIFAKAVEGLDSENAGFEYDDGYFYADVLNVKGDEQEVTHRTLSGYDPFGDNWAAAHGGNMRVLVRNPPSVNHICGDFVFGANTDTVVFCVWHHRLGIYTAVSIENDDKDHTYVQVKDQNDAEALKWVAVPPWCDGP